jgi:hypothetical protein
MKTDLMPLRLQEKENVTAKFSAADLFEFASLAFVLPIDLAVARRDISDYLVKINRIFYRAFTSMEILNSVAVQRLGCISSNKEIFQNTSGVC